MSNNIQGGLFNLANTMQRGQTGALNVGNGLLQGMGNALSLNSEIKPGDADSMRAAAEGQMRTGNTVEAARLEKMAVQTETQQAEKLQKGISEAYGAMVAAGRGKEYEDAMIKAGRGDEMAQVKREKMTQDILTIEHGNAQRAGQIRDLSKGYYTATTPEGRELALTRMAEEGFGKEAQALRQEEAKISLEKTKNDLAKSKVEWDMQVQKIKALPVPEDPEQLAAVRSKVPEELRGIYDQQTAAVMEAKSELEDARLRRDKGELLSQEFVESVGIDYEDYKAMFKVGGKKVNENMIKARIDGIKTEASTLPTKVASEQLGAMFDSMNIIEDGGVAYFDSEVVDPEMKSAVILATWDAMQKGASPVEAMQEAMIEIPLEMELLKQLGN